MKTSKTAILLLASCLTAPAFAQDSLPRTSAETAEDEGAAIIVTGSRIKQDPTKSALPLQVITTDDLTREGINSPEQLISFLSTNGNGADNLASNADVTSGAQRGTNGLSAANLRGQGAASTLVLLNGRRVAAHGLTGSAVDVNQIPIAALERVEILKDGASAIYGTDAIGGVINFITKTNFQGLALNAFTDVTEAGGGNIYRLSATGGYGDLDEDGFNIMGAVSRSISQSLNGSERSFVNGNQPNRGLSVDTRGTPIATAFPANANTTFAPSGSLLGDTNVCSSGSIANNNCVRNARYLGNGTGFFLPGSTQPADGGINILDLPGGAGCDTVEGGLAYDEQLWNTASARFACAWDTGRAAVLQQPLNTLTYYGRGTLALGDHRVFAEITGSDADSVKRFSNNQYSINVTSLPLYYPLNAITAATYNDVYDRIAGIFPAIGAPGTRTVGVGRYGLPIAYRWRNIAGGQREYRTNTNTLRGAIGAEGPLFGSFDYRAGASYARSESNSVLGEGYHYRGVFVNGASATASGVAGAVAGGIDPRAPTAPGATRPGIVGLLNSGILNPFSVSQSPAALAGLDAISARGVTLYGGLYEVRQFDASIAGSLFDLPGGAVKIAFGVDYRKESYTFNGSPAAISGTPDIFNVAFDNINALAGVSRDVKAAYGEILIPLFDSLEVTAAARIDEYEGFGSTVNPKISAKFQPLDWVMFRGSYNTGFRVPTFNQIFNGVTQSQTSGTSIYDPSTCAGPASPSVPGCASITPDTINGGNRNLGPETSEQYSVGIVLQPSSQFSASVDYWSIAVDDVIGSLIVNDLLRNAAFFPERFARNSAGQLTALDLRTANLGSRRTEGLEVALRGGFDALGGVVTAGLDGTYLLKKKSKVLPLAPYLNDRGRFTFAGDLGLKWKHSAFVSFTNDDFTFNFSQIYRDGYTNQALPGIANGSVVRPDFNPKVKAYMIYNTSVSVDVLDQFRLTAGVRNVFDKDPPFAITYDSNTGAGSSWEPRVADPRGRSFTLSVEAKF
ncbi:TonB-dependent receptor domain-containing protein [Sphingorhabdus sp.]|jgi:iron complex outermembrane receptor protein|uniref:TonB-dependent receptor domain-containing protein n=2 Tax=Sphingorhabdus sp. TaxID=1902408 RepID=UPI0037CB3A99